MPEYKPVFTWDHAGVMFRGTLFVPDVPASQSRNGLYMQDVSRSPDTDDAHLMMALNIGKTAIIFEPTHEQVKDIRDYMDRWLAFYTEKDE